MAQGVSVYGADSCGKRAGLESTFRTSVCATATSTSTKTLSATRVRGWNEGVRRTPTVVVRACRVRSPECAE
jgi:hypothetical protein